MEVTRPYKRQHGSSEGTDESHEDTEMRDEDRHQDGKDDHPYPPRESPDLQLPVDGPYRREHGLGPAPEERSFEELAGRVIRQGIREHGFHDQAKVYQPLEPGRVQIIRDHLLRVVLERQEADPTEQRLERRGRDVAPVQHPIELGPIDQVPL